MAQKLIDRNDILYDLITNIAPQYFDMDSLDQNRTSYFGYLSEADAKAIEDTITLEQRRAVDYCPELSNSEARVRQTAKIRNVTVRRATPARAFAAIGLLKDDIIDKGEQYGKYEKRFTIDRRSTITYEGLAFSLPDDIIIRAITKGSNTIFSASYSGEHQMYDSYLQVYEQTNEEDGSEYLMLTVVLYQYSYNIQEQVVTDAVTFMYDGLTYDYQDMLADFEVYYRKTATDDYTKLDIDHYLTMDTSNAIYYNDDESSVLYILNNPNLNIPVNSMIRVDIKETRGTDGEMTLTDSEVFFSLYKDEGYNYAGINVNCVMLSDVIGANNGDNLEDIKKALIDAKTRRDNITTEHDIISYINDIDANVQIIKKRNDIEDRRVYLYTLLRLNREIVPTTTRNLYIRGLKNVYDIGDFDYADYTGNYKVIRAYNKFKMIKPENWPEENEYMVKVPADEQEEGAYYFTCPFMIMINDDELVNYYLTTINQEILLAKSTLPADTLFPYEMITPNINIYRNSHDKENYDTYTFTVVMTRNTANDNDLLDSIVDESGDLLDYECVICYLVFRQGSTPAAYLPMKISNYNKDTREFTFTGTMKTNDIITAEDKLHIISGLYQVNTQIPTKFNSVIDYKNSFFDLYCMYKTDDTESYARTHSVFQYVSKQETEGYALSTAYFNNANNPYNLIYEFNKFTSSWNYIQPLTQTTISHTIYEVPFVEYEYGIEHMVELYPTFESMMDTYGNLLKLTTDFDISLKFISTWGRSKYLYISGGRNADGEEETYNLKNLNPKLRFRVYGKGIDVTAVRDYIYEYFRDNYITDDRIFISNVCTLVEDNFSRVKSIKFMGVDDYDGSFQEFYYDPPEFVSQDVITRYIPEQINTPYIEIELDED